MRKRTGDAFSPPTKKLKSSESVFVSTRRISLNWSYINQVEDLNSMKTFRWTERIWSTLVDLFRSKCNTSDLVSGYMSALPYCLYEHTMKANLEKQTLFPRCERWELSEMPKDMNALCKNSKDIIETRLIPSDEERGKIENYGTYRQGDEAEPMNNLVDDMTYHEIQMKKYKEQLRDIERLLTTTKEELEKEKMLHTIVEEKSYAYEQEMKDLRLTLEKDKTVPNRKERW
ncbi:hypothetical protein AKJ16_DCAP10779 [Drosera capensis]